MPDTPPPDPSATDPDRYRALYRRAMTIVQRHAHPIHEDNAAGPPPWGGLIYRHNDLHYVVMDARAMFGEIFLLLAGALAPERNEFRLALRAARERLAEAGSGCDAASAAEVLAQVEAALRKPADPFGAAWAGGIDGWRSALTARFERAQAHAETREDEWWQGFASGLHDALSAHTAYVAHGRGICVVGDRRHAALWQARRAAGEPIRSRWIEAGGADTEESRADDLPQAIAEASACGVTLWYGEPGDASEDALVAIGAALAGGRKVLVVGAPAPGALLRHPLVKRERDLTEAFAEARRILGIAEEPPLPSWLFASRPG